LYRRDSGAAVSKNLVMRLPSTKNAPTGVAELLR